MTKKLYDQNSKLRNWNTNIKEVIEDNNGQFLLTLEETSFYPEGGGQPADSGVIDGIEVVYVFEENGEVFHKVNEKPEKNVVSCEINWQRRFDHMQQHTGQHLLSAVCIELYDAYTTSFHLGIETVTIDLNVTSLTTDQLQAIEAKVNQYIYENLEIKTYSMDKKDIHTLALRKLPEIDEDKVRIVEIEGIDVSACCGTHVERTGEIGLIKLLKAEKQRGNIRLFFKCGFRALMDYQESQLIISTLLTSHSATKADVIEKIQKQETELKELKKQIELLKNEQLTNVASEILQENHHDVIVKSFDLSMKDIQTIANSIHERTNNTIVFTSMIDKKVLVSHNGDSEKHCGHIVKKYLSLFSGKGGGSNKQAQASFDEIGQLEGFVKVLSTEF